MVSLPLLPRGSIGVGSPLAALPSKPLPLHQDTLIRSRSRWRFVHQVYFGIFRAIHPPSSQTLPLPAPEAADQDGTIQGRGRRAPGFQAYIGTMLLILALPPSMPRGRLSKGERHGHQEKPDCVDR